jgi:hypothetical protein
VEKLGNFFYEINGRKNTILFRDVGNPKQWDAYMNLINDLNKLIADRGESNNGTHA